VDGKAKTNLTVIAALLAAFGLMLNAYTHLPTSFFKFIANNHLTAAIILLGSATIITICIAFAILLKLLRPIAVQAHPRVEDILDAARTNDPATFKQELTDYYRQASRENRKAKNKKSRLLACANGFIFFSLIIFLMLFVAVMVVVWFLFV
jgi:hypothetical protein